MNVNALFDRETNLSGRSYALSQWTKCMHLSFSGNLDGVAVCDERVMLLLVACCSVDISRLTLELQPATFMTILLFAFCSIRSERCCGCVQPGLSGMTSSMQSFLNMLLHSGFRKGIESLELYKSTYSKRIEHQRCVLGGITTCEHFNGPATPRCWTL